VAEDAVVVEAEKMNTFADKVGLGWRADLAAGICSHLDRIDLLEVVADDFFDAPRRDLRALQTLATQVPVVLHGVGMGLASSAPVENKRLEKMARLVEQVRPQFWSEHLAFVRSGGIEIGHLAAPPRTADTVEGAAENLSRAATLIGSKPIMENIATLIDPPGSTLSESVWISGILASSDCHLLLDLHNVYANGLNHGYDPKAFLRQIPAVRIRAIHIAGGKFISAPDGRRRLLDDHLHDVPSNATERILRWSACCLRSIWRARLSLAADPGAPFPRKCSYERPGIRSVPHTHLRGCRRPRPLQSPPARRSPARRTLR
jgi:uncharacterized protein (UPF0276 family)